MCACSKSTKSTSESNNENSLFADEDFYDFGTINEKDSVLYHTFVIKNGTKTTQYIDHIESSCGCTKVNAEFDSITSGAECKINAVIKTAGYLGHIIRDIDVYIVGQEEPLSFSVAAYIPMPIQAIKAKYSKKLSENVYTCYSVVNVGNVYIDSNSYGYTELVNMSDETINVTSHTDSKLVKLDAPENLEPLIPARFYVYYDNSSIKSWGVDTTTIYIDVENVSVPIKCVANILPYPKNKNTKISPRILNYSTEIINSKSVLYTFSFRNIGAESLEIVDYKVSTNIKIVHIDKLIKPSENGNIEFKTSNRGDGYIDVLTNDPLTPIVRYRIIGQPEN